MYNVSATFSLTYKSVSHMSANGYSMCYYSYSELNSFQSELYYELMPRSTCVQVQQTLNFTEKFHIEKVHHWPGIPDSFGTNFLMKLVGSFYIEREAEYEFYTRGTNAIRISIDSVVMIEMGYAGGSYSESTANVTLTEGYHLLTIYYNHYDLDAHLAVVYRVLGTSSWNSFSHDNLFYNGRGPSFLKYEDIQAHVGETVNTTFSRLRMGAATKFTISPTLPTGLVMNEETGRLTGSITSPVNQLYTVTAEGMMGSCEATFSLLADEIPAAGIHGRYYAVDESVDVCSQAVFHDYEMDLITEKTDVSLSFPFQPRKGFWPSIPASVFSGKAYIEWNGFLRIDAVGEYSFYVAFNDGVRITIDGTALVDSFSCNGKQKVLQPRIEFAKTGFHSLQIQFFTNDDDFLFVMKMMKPGMSEFIDIPKEMLWHYPKRAFTMSVEETQLIVNRDIERIDPIFYSFVTDHPTFSIQPDLPSGLILNADGTITGAPKTEFSSSTFTITLQNGGSVYTTFVILSCYSPQLPTEITVTNSAGEEVSSLTLDIFKTMETVNIDCKEKSTCSVSIQPSLPSGIAFDTKTGKLTGRPTRSSAETTYTITGKTEAGSITKSFTIRIPSCEHGNYFYIHTVGGHYDVSITKGSVEVFHETNKESSEFSSIICIPNNDYTFLIKNSTSLSLSSFSLIREDGVKYFDVTLQNSVFTAPLETILHEKPSLVFAIQRFYFFEDEVFAIHFSGKGLYRPLRTTTELPYGIALNESDNTFGGSIHRTGKHTFTIVCENEAGSTETVLEFYVGSCPEEYVMLFGENAGSKEGDRMTIRRESNQELLFDRDLHLDPNKRILLCLDNSQYIMTLYTQTNADNDYSRHFTLLDRNSTVMGTYTLDHQGEEEHHLSFLSIFKEGQDRKAWISSKKVGKKWKDVDFKDSKWSVMNANSRPRFNNNYRTVYFRSNVYVNEYDDTGAVVIYVKANGGFIMYVNGVEAVRINLPSGSISNEIMGHRDIDLSEWFRVSLNPNLFGVGSNLIAVELHCYVIQEASTQEIYFDWKSYQLSSRSFYRSNKGDGIPSGSSHLAKPEGSPENAFFSTNDYTFWSDGELPSWIRFTFPEQHLEFVNKMIIRSTALGLYDPTHFTVYGVRNQTFFDNGRYSYTEVKEPLKVVNNYYLFNGTREEVTIFLDTRYPYQAYEMEVLRGMNDTTDLVRINHIRFYSEKRIWCTEGEKWEASLADETSYGKCPFLMIGESTRYCRNVNHTGVWDEVDKTTCLSRWAGKNVAYLDLTYKIVNCTMKLWDTAVEKALKEVIVREVTVKEEEVLFYLPKLCSRDEDVPAICVNARLTPHRLTSEYVRMELMMYNSNATGLFYKKSYHGVPPSMTILPGEKISMHQRWSGKETVLISIIIIMVLLYFVLLVMYCKNVRTGRNSLRKTLRKKNPGSEKSTKRDPLLKI